GVINLNDTVQIPTLAAPDGDTTLCRNINNQLSACAANANGVTLQLAYDAGNTITTTTGRNIDFTLYDETSNSGTATSFSLTNAGSAPAFIVNDTKTGTTGTALEIQSGGVNKLTISELGNLSTTGNIET